MAARTSHSSPRRAAAPIERLAERFAAGFPAQRRGRRRIGREAEFPLIRPDGRAGDVALLWEPLLAEPGARPSYDDPPHRQLIVRIDFPDAAYEVEMGRATAEMVLPPAEDLFALEAASWAALDRLRRAARTRGMILLGYGIQPRTPAGPGLMTPKRRYFALSRAVGWPWMYFTSTAADQVQVDIARPELVEAVNVMNLLSGPIIALTANSPVYAGRVGRFLSGREGLLAALGEERHGMTPRRFASVEEFLTFTCGQTFYVRPEAHRFPRYGRPFTSYLAARGGRRAEALWQDYLWHEHYIWNSARPRVHNGTIEVRPACQQPPDEPMAAVPLCLGLVEALPQVTAFLEDRLGRDPWPAMRAYRRAVLREGPRVLEPTPGLLAGLVTLSEDALRARGRHEETFLGPIRRRLEARSVPADRAVRLFRQGGIPAIVEALKV